MKTNLLIALSVIFSLTSFAQSENYTTKTATEDGYTYEYVVGDPLKTRIYTLKNGLKAYLSVYKDAPKIQTYIAVRAGAKDDPSQNTGLAHYLEHIMFKGTSQFGTKDWETEAPLLDSIEAMFNHYSTLTDTAERRAYYALIDSVSYEASKYAIANEYDKLVGNLGATGTNAYTAADRTVYVNNIPSNSLEKWLKIEANRFSEIVCRLFHTELEAVYEEKNRGLDSDMRTAYEALLSGLFQKHTYGTQTAIGTIDHLKNPSITAIKKFFDKQYRPNNVAICLSGDLDPAQTIKWIDQYWSGWEPKDIEEKPVPVEEDITEPIEKTVIGPDVEAMFMAYRIPGVNSKEALLAEMVDMVLSNRSAGLIDLNIKKKQKIVDGYSFVTLNNDYGFQAFFGQPKQGQSLQEVRDLFLAEIEKVKKGEFEDWLIEAIINDFEKASIKQQEKNSDRAHSLVYAFTQHADYADYISKVDKMRRITKQELVDFANKYYNNNYVIVYKKNGETERQKVDKPQITSVVVNRDDVSDFRKDIDSMANNPLTPMFMDFTKDLEKTTLMNGTEVLYKKNEENGLFNVYYVFDMGTQNDKTLGMAVNYLKYLGTKDHTAEELSIEFYKLGSSFNVSTGLDQTYVVLEGLTQNMVKSMQLFEGLLNNPVVNEEALVNLIETSKKKRLDAMKNKGRILHVNMVNYAKYGPNNPSTNVLSDEELMALDAKVLVNKLKNLSKYEHKVLYYGPETLETVKETLEAHHKMPKKFKAPEEGIEFTEQPTDGKKVYWVDYDMVQAEIIFLSKSVRYDINLAPEVALFNTYFGGGMGAIVFQEMRESKALAYSVYSRYLNAKKKEESNYIKAYIGTQADKLPEATSSLLELMNNMPESDNAYNNAKVALKNILESGRTTKSNVLFKYLQAEKLGIHSDVNKVIYDKLEDISMMKLKAFHGKYFKDKQYTVLVIGAKDKLDFEALKQYGELEELSLEQIFGYSSEEETPSAE